MKKTTYEKRQEKELTLATLHTLLMDLNGGLDVGKNGWAISRLNESTDEHEALAFFKDKGTAKRVRRILRSVMHKSFDDVYTLSLIPSKDVA